MNIQQTIQASFGNSPFTLDSHHHIYAKNCKGEYLYCNEQMLKDVGYENKSVLGLTDLDFQFLSIKEACGLRKNDKAIMTYEIPKTIIEPVTLCSGKKAMAISYKTPLRDNCHNVIGVSGVSLILYNNEFQETQTSQNNSSAFDIQDPLSAREKECLYHLLRGKSAREIAMLLNLSRRTIEYYISNIKIKMNVSSKSELIDKMIDHVI